VAIVHDRFSTIIIRATDNKTFKINFLFFITTSFIEAIILLSKK
jgi:hypothetical protein